MKAFFDKSVACNNVALEAMPVWQYCATSNSGGTMRSVSSTTVRHETEGKFRDFVPKCTWFLEISRNFECKPFKRDLKHEKNARYFKVAVTGRTVSKGFPVDFFSLNACSCRPFPFYLMCSASPVLLFQTVSFVSCCLCEMNMNPMSLSAALDQLVWLICLLIQIGKIKQTFPLLFLCLYC